MSNASAAVAPAFTFGAFTGAGDRSAVEVDGFRIVATICRDDNHGAPWEENDGHGEVSDWTSRDKAPGELVLASDCDSKRFYDFAGAVVLARRDWIAGPFPYRTVGIAAEAAARQDFEWLKAWSDDEWHWCGVSLSVYRAGVNLTGEHAAALWGIECGGPGFTGEYLNEVAADLIGEALDVAREALERLAA